MQPVEGQDECLAPIMKSPKFRTDCEADDTLHKCEQCGHEILCNQVTMFGRPRIYLHMECFKIWRGREVGKK